MFYKVFLRHIFSTVDILGFEKRVPVNDDPHNDRIHYLQTKCFILVPLYFRVERVPECRSA